jgi:endonuclease/exonuclease/phosphatase (EEP) superfamily protein YafD
MLREFRGAMTALAFVACLALLAVSFDVGLPGQALLQSLRFHVAGVVLALSIVLFASGAWWRGLLFLVVAGASATQGGLIIRNQQDVRLEAVSQGVRPLFTLLSFNLLSTNPNGAEIAEFLSGSGADVVMLMEAAAVATQRETLVAAYPYVASCDRCDIAILSRTPLGDVKFRSLGQIWPNRLVTASTVIEGTRINLALAHLVKPYYDDLATNEVYLLSEYLKRLEGPLLLAGDFNAAAWSDNVDRLARWRGLAPGPSYPATWPVDLGPVGVPIDNVFTRAPLVITDVRATENTFGSNHRGLLAEVAIAAEK